MSHRCMLYSCKADNHHHFIIGPENISWPFWSRAAGVRLADYSASMYSASASVKERGEIEAVFRQLKEDVEVLARARNRDERGRFTSGFRMPREFLYQEGNVAVSWSRFRRGDSAAMCYWVENTLGSFLLPLYCDFVRREEEPKEGVVLRLDRKQLIELAEKPAKPVTMAELGITLPPA